MIYKAPASALLFEYIQYIYSSLASIIYIHLPYIYHSGTYPDRNTTYTISIHIRESYIITIIHLELSFPYKAPASAILLEDIYNDNAFTLFENTHMYFVSEYMTGLMVMKPTLHFNSINEQAGAV